jgi:hypothetical protein
MLSNGTPYISATNLEAAMLFHRATAVPCERDPTKMRTHVRILKHSVDRRNSRLPPQRIAQNVTELKYLGTTLTISDSIYD